MYTVGDRVRMNRKSSDAYGQIGTVMEIEGTAYFVKFAGFIGWFIARKSELKVA